MEPAAYRPGLPLQLGLDTMATLRQLAFLLIAVGPVIHAQPMSVCDVLADLSALHGKQIKVRGIWRKGDAGEVLWASFPCEKPTIRDHWEFSYGIRVGPTH